MDDDNVAEERKSEPLYRDVSSTGQNGQVRAKYAGLESVDAKMVALSLFYRGDFKGLLEFNISRSAVGRGGEHRALRWDQGSWDWFYDSLDMDWQISKQLDQQCMLFFHDSSLFSLDVYLAFAIYFLFDGLFRPSTMPEARKPFVFPYLHQIKKESVAERMTNLIRGNVPNNRKKAFTSRSMRKGASTELAAHRDISTDERYCRGGWATTHHNPNGNTYIELTPILNAPGGKALAGYDDCHGHLYPPHIECLGSSVPEDVVPRLLNSLYVNDVPELQLGGKLRPLVSASLASLIRHYKSIIHEMGYDNPIVKKIHEMFKKANIEDHSIPSNVTGPRHLAILRSWSERVSADFDERNKKRVEHDAPVEQQVHALATEMHALTNAFHQHKEESSHQIHSHEQTIQILMKQNSILLAGNERIKRKVGEIPPGHRNAESPPRRRNSSQVTTTSTRSVTDNDTETVAKDIAQAAEIVPPSAKKLKVDGTLDASAAPSIKTGYIKASEVFMKFLESGKWKDLHERAKKDMCGALPVHQAFRMSGEDKKYYDGMKIVALSISKQQWEMIVEGNMNDKEFEAIDASAKIKIRELEIMTGLVDPNKTKGNKIM